MDILEERKEAVLKNSEKGCEMPTIEQNIIANMRSQQLRMSALVLDKNMNSVR